MKTRAINIDLYDKLFDLSPFTPQYRRLLLYNILYAHLFDGIINIISSYEQFGQSKYLKEYKYLLWTTTFTTHKKSADIKILWSIFF